MLGSLSVRVLTALLVVASPLTAQTDTIRTDTVTMYVDGNRLLATRVPTPREADSLWTYDQACADFPAMPGELAQVVWLRGSVTEVSDNHSQIGQWFPPDSILLDNTVLTDSGVVTDTLLDAVAHELLHQLLRGPYDTPHPRIPFVEPCHLMYEQHHNTDNTKRYIERKGLNP